MDRQGFGKKDFEALPTAPASRGESAVTAQAAPRAGARGPCMEEGHADLLG